MALAGEEIHRHVVEGFPDCYVKVESIFQPRVGQGALPFRITFRNQSGADRVCSVKFLLRSEIYYGGGFDISSSYRLTAKDNATAVREVYVPVAPSHTSGGYVQIRFLSEISGLSSEQSSMSLQTAYEFPSLAISSNLAKRNLTALDATVNKSVQGKFAAPFVPEELPSSWLGYSALDALLIDISSWKTLSEIQHQAILSWVRLGGRLDLYDDPGSPALATAPTSLNGIQFKGNFARLSLGEIRLLEYPIDDLPTTVIFDLYKNMPRASAALAEDYSDSTLDSARSSPSREAVQSENSAEPQDNRFWPLLGELNVQQNPPILAMIFLVLFAILVAPVNLYFLAGKDRRQRLFITTPLISLVACLVITASIFLIDGIGGHGIRVVLADLQPSSKETHIFTTQEQLSRTGVMLSTGFTRKQEFNIDLIRLPNLPLNPFSDRRGENSNFAFDGNLCDGPFFRSRSIQGYSLRSFSTDRIRIEQTGVENGTPILTSSLSTEIMEFYYIDPSGKAWLMPSAQTVAPGAHIPLQKSENRLPDWANNTINRFGSTRRNRIRQMIEPNRFFAKIRNPEQFALATHPRIDWQETDLLLTGSAIIFAHPIARTAPTRP